MLSIKVHPQCPFSEKQIRKFLDRLEVMPNGCYYWTGARAGDYGRVGLNSRLWPTHQVAWIIVNGPIPDGKIILHGCPGGDTPICCNWEHLSAGTHAENTRQMWERGRGNPPKGERSSLHVLSRQSVSEIKNALNEGLATQKELSERYQVSDSCINAIRSEYSWSDVEPRIKPIIPVIHSKLSSFDYVDIRDKWRSGSTLKSLSDEYGVRVDTIQKIIDGRRGKSAPVGDRVIRQNKCKLSAAVRHEILARYLKGETQISLAREYGMSKNGINLMLQRLSA